MILDPVTLTEIALSVAGAVSVAYYFLKGRSSTPSKEIKEETTTTVTTSTPVVAAKAPSSKWIGVLQKTRDRWFSFSSSEKNLLKEKLEEALLGADVGFKATQDLLSQLDFAKDWDLLRTDLANALSQNLKTSLGENILSDWPSPKSKPHVILFVGVNGVGKTTSVAKLTRELKDKGKSVILAAGDTFRAAASEQLKQWGDRLDVRVIEGSAGADSSSVLFDAVKSAISKDIDYVLCDSAGRLHNNDQLMENLAKNKRVLEKALPSAPHDTILVLDANTGQNMISQAKKFGDLGLTGLILTKLDGSAKGGAIVALSSELKIPIYRIGVGESQEDLLNFNSKEFSEALVGI